MPSFLPILLTIGGFLFILAIGAVIIVSVVDEDVPAQARAVTGKGERGVRDRGDLGLVRVGKNRARSDRSENEASEESVLHELTGLFMRWLPWGPGAPGRCAALNQGARA